MKEPRLTTIGSDPGEWEGTYISFSYAQNQPASGKTTAWEVCNKGESSTLGFVKWFPRWRKYAFLPVPNCIFEELCMREISLFIEERTKEHRAGV